MSRYGATMGFGSLRDVKDDSMRLCCSRKDEADSLQPGLENGAAKGPSTGSDVEKFGLYQMAMFAFISIPLMLSAGFTLAYIFTAGEVKYRCLVPECEHAGNATFDPLWINASAPKTENGAISGCTRYTVRDDRSGTCTEASFTNVTRDCDSWIYDPDERTILNEWGFTCDANRWKLTLVGTIQNTGQFVGLMFAGYISDRYGRRTFLTLSTFLSGVSGLIHSFSVNYWMFLAFEFLDATMAAGIYSAGFILGMETVGVKNRVFGSTIICCMFAMGEIFLGLIASWLRSWRTLLRVIYGPGLLAILLPLFIPESVRWLLSKGKHDEVEKIYRKIARMNGLQVTDEAINSFKELSVPKDETKSELVISDERKPIVQVLHSSVILIRLLVCSFCWLTNTFVYYGLSLNSVAFAGDKYINFVLVAVVEIPAYCLAWVLTDRIGRKPTLSGAFLLSGAFCLAIQFVPTGAWSYGPLLLYMAGKLCITMAFGTVYVYTAELFPTTLRHSLLGICSMTGRVGSILSPQTPLLAQIMPSLPLILFGSMGMIAGVLSLIFPETLGTKLPDTVWEAERIGKSNGSRKILGLTTPSRQSSSVER
ncbi:solute carrier family 22 member 21-like isoform X1 [Temnothorax curvispinosus]|uniref:Solute carrier family 22 member 21-like isoform X1 n=2 Tax=Temnothorax curvispinosus TaxID=300111 RepID=A0A6J1PLV0_9HYME|nr:solute carrier family 22 member 21-like isoform X1 [Temnothorax curvispinosus]XP_024870665.1 solute carrier family 22 member 21-like isoform X1 [Temnothorax curvispinosus]